jgi:hypothetical protein
VVAELVVGVREAHGDDSLDDAVIDLEDRIRAVACR